MADRRLALSFDNGPDPHVTPRVLTALAKRGLKATFFPVGNKLVKQGALAVLDQIVAGGHVIGNHTYSHPRPFGMLTAEAAIEEIMRTEVLLGGRQSADRLFRPSAGGGELKRGVLNRGVANFLISEGFSLVLWNLVVEDWSRPDGSWTKIALGALAEQKWANLVLHDIPNGGMAFLEEFLDTVLASGVEITPDFPPETVPIFRGKIRKSIDDLLPLVD